MRVEFLPALFFNSAERARPELYRCVSMSKLSWSPTGVSVLLDRASWHTRDKCSAAEEAQDSCNQFMFCKAICLDAMLASEVEKEGCVSADVRLCEWPARLNALFTYFLEDR